MIKARCAGTMRDLRLDPSQVSVFTGEDLGGYRWEGYLFDCPACSLTHRGHAGRGIALLLIDAGCRVDDPDLGLGAV